VTFEESIKLQIPILCGTLFRMDATCVNEAQGTGSLDGRCFTMNIIQTNKR